MNPWWGGPVRCWHTGSSWGGCGVQKMDMSSGLQPHNFKSRQGDRIKFCSFVCSAKCSFDASARFSPLKDDLYSAWGPLFSIPKAPEADTIVTQASEQIIEMHQRRLWMWEWNIQTYFGVVPNDQYAHQRDHWLSIILSLWYSHTFVSLCCTFLSNHTDTHGHTLSFQGVWKEGN